MGKTRLLCVGTVIVLLAGCANLNSIHREFQTDTGKIVAIDAKQRAISIKQTNTGVKMCVEQSPDVFSFLNESLGLSAETKAAVASLAAAVAESGGSLAFRTQVTQAQSNFLFNVCQMNANGAMTDRAVRTELRRFQQTLLGFMAIEQLTAPNRAMPAQQVLSTSTASVGKDVDVAQSKVDLAKDDVSAKEKVQATAEKKVEDEGKKGTDSDAYKQAVTELDKAKQDLQKASTGLELAQKQLQAARLALNVSAGGAQQSIINVYAPPTNGVSDEVAKQVVQVVDAVLNRGALLDYCSELIMEGNTPLSQDATTICKDAFKAYVDTYSADHKTYQKVIESEVGLRSMIFAQTMDLYNKNKIDGKQYFELMQALLKAPADNFPTPAPKPPPLAPFSTTAPMPTWLADPPGRVFVRRPTSEK